MGLDLNNPAIAAVFGGVCTGVIHIISTIIVSWINRKSLVRDLATIVHDYLSEDINYYGAPLCPHFSSSSLHQTQVNIK